MGRVVALRHGETDWNRNRRMQGWAPVSLNDRGRDQAAAAGRWIADRYDVDRIIASDLERTRETADIVYETLETDVPLDHEHYWRERDIGIYQGLGYDDVGERFPAFSLGESGYRAVDRTPEGGESLLDVYERVSGRFEELRSEANGETVLVVSHGGPINLLLGHVKGMDVETALRTHHQENCAVNEIDAIAPDVVRENHTEWR